MPPVHSSRGVERLRSVRHLLARTLFNLRLSLARRPKLSWQLNPFVRNGSDDMVLVTVAFNNASAILAQAMLLAQNLDDPYQHVVVDNSPSREARRVIRDACRRHSSHYLRAPRSPYTGRDPSLSHAEALNYCVARMPRLDRSSVVGFLDHDIFPVTKHSVGAILAESKAYGRRQEMSGGWYLWPGLCFFKRGTVDLATLDFSPLRGVGDTGARLYDQYLRSWAVDDVVFTVEAELRLANGELPPIELHDAWAHTTSASGWRGKGTMQVESIQALLATCLDTPDQEFP